MIRSIGRYGVVERSLSQTAFARQKPVHLTLNAYTYRQSLILHSARSRFLSDSNSTPTVKTESPNTEVVPPPPIPPRKPKVELRPAPVRNAPTNKQQPAPAKPLSDGHVSVSTGKEQAETASSGIEHGRTTEEKAASIVETTRADLRDAQIHGVLAPPPPDAGKLGQLWHQAKELFKFYFRGMKLVYTHRVKAREMTQRVKSGGPPLSRWEARFIERSRSDVKKLIPFVMIVLVIEEIIPLIVLYAPWMLPTTCVLPSQRERIEKKRREKQAAISQVMGRDLRGIIESAGRAASVSLRNLSDGAQLIALCGMLSLSTFGPPPTRIRRIERHLKYVAEDDALLKEEGMGNRLTEPELYDALEERGLVFTGLKLEEARERLAWWLRSTDSSADGDPVGRRVVLVARSGLGQY